MIHTGDCIAVMRTMPSESVDAIVTDPPAGIAFMSKHWDRDKGGRTAWVAWMTEVMVECHRLLKPGGYAVVWSLPRTCHWTAWAMEDAGFIIRDQLAHVFASGFPKGKAQLKPAREDWWLARKPGPLRALNIDLCRIDTTDDLNGGAYTEGRTPRAMAPGGAARNAVVDGPFEQPAGRWPSNLLLSDPELFDVANPGVVGSGAVTSTGDIQPYEHHNSSEIYGGGKGWRTASGQITGNHRGDTGGYSRFFRIPRYGDEQPESSRSEDAGVSDGTRGSRQDGAGDGRSDQGHRDSGQVAPEDSDRGAIEGYPKAFLVPKADRADREPVLRGQLPKRNAGSTNWRYENDGAHETFSQPAPDGIGTWLSEQRKAAGLTRKQVAAHFPSRSGGLTGCVTNWEEGLNRPTADQWVKLREVIGFDDRYDSVMTTREPSGYVKPEKPTSPRENAHPTVKPTDLMRHLVRLVTPPGGTVLDCFLGSGSTAIACELEGFPWLGIEQDAGYVAIAEARLNGVQRGLGLDVPAPTRRRAPGGDDIGAVARRGRKPHNVPGWGFASGTPPVDVEEPA